MKIILLLAFIACTSAITAQTRTTSEPSVTQKPTSAADYIKTAPVFPVNVCTCDPSARDTYQSAVRELKQTILDDVNERERERGEFMESREGDIKANMVKMSGMSQEDIKKLQSGKEMSEADKMAMVNKMMQQRANVSMEEMKKVSKMSKAGQEAWAQGYAAEQQAVAETGGQQKNPMADMAAGMSANVSEQMAVSSRLQSMQADLNQKYQQLIAGARADRALLEKECQPFYKIMNSHDGEGATQKDVEDDRKARAQVKILQDKYCQKWTPEMLEFLKECRSTIEKAFPDYDQLEELGYQSFEKQAGKKMERRVAGIESIKAVTFYLEFAEDTFQFRLN